MENFKTKKKEGIKMGRSFRNTIWEKQEKQKETKGVLYVSTNKQGIMRHEQF